MICLFAIIFHACRTVHGCGSLDPSGFRHATALRALWYALTMRSLSNRKSRALIADLVAAEIPHHLQQHGNRRQDALFFL